MKNRKRLTALLLAVFCLMSLAACSKGPEEQAPETVSDTLVVGYDSLAGQLNPFYIKTEADTDVCALTAVRLLTSDRAGSIVLKGIDGETISYQGTPYTYTGVSDCTIEKNEDGTVTYAFTLRDDIVFSDGEPLTADDVIFTMYVLADPAYDGTIGFASLPIVGLQEYQNGMQVVADLIAEAGEENTDFTYWTKDQQEVYWSLLTGEAGTAFAQEIVDYCIANGHASNVAEAMEAWGHSDGVDPDKEMTAADFFAYLCEAYDYAYADFAEKEAAGTSLFAIAKELASKKDPIYATAVQTGDTADSIMGINRTGDYSFTITTEGFDAAAIYKLAIHIAPLHYYGDKANFDYDAGRFGFEKGNLTPILSKNGAPLGAGPYRFLNTESGVVSFEANEKYYKGQPKIQTIKFREMVGDSAKVDGITSGSLDIAKPSLNAEIVQAIKNANEEGELTGSALTCELVDFNGYGYIGISANQVLVGHDAGSDESKNLRKALATLIAVYREEAIQAYYGEMAEVIEYPISNTSWAAPRVGDAGYETAFAKDVDGEPLYDSAMTNEEKQQAALEAAIAYLIAAGYSFDEAAHTFTDAPQGAKMTYTIIVPGGGQGDHPAYGIALKVKEALASIGLTLNISDPADAKELWTALDTGKAELWAAAFGETLDPDMYPTYYSENVPTNDSGTGRNNYYVADDVLDQYILDARNSDDTAYRKDVYKDCLAILMDWAIEVPTYQRLEGILFSTQRIQIDTLTPDMTPYWTWLSGIESMTLR
ncbi:MAG: ABC transporter substrate-binding protein [Clostridiales bacterium]|nr:ABC transporter substrate-binding protein [Clostridiales bacterium]